ncbi:MAG: type II toxin-antitoxin system VapC family toxin [Acidobacteria bacterium]|nr:type II toxin-antitoxin system VapC family toxin [Acidobacteriota bacterium]
MWAYVDTSALAKRYIDEAGRREALQLLRRYSLVTSVVLPVELCGAFRRRVAEGTLEAARLPGILSRVSADRQHWTLVEAGAEVLAAAETLVSTRPLRTLDAIHVASAQLFAARMSMPALLFVSADRRQTEAAAFVGLTARLIA